MGLFNRRRKPSTPTIPIPADVSGRLQRDFAETLSQVERQVDEAATAMLAEIRPLDAPELTPASANDAREVVPWRSGPEELATVATRLVVEPRREWLDEQVEVVGETYHVKGIKKVFRGRGMPVPERGITIDDVDCVLVPEPWNPHDINAVAVLVDNQLVGYVPADLARDYAGPLGDLATHGKLVRGEARIWAKAEGNMIRARVTILIPESSEL